MRRFEFVDGKSNKFWEAKTEGPKLLVRFGRIGGTWQESDKLLANAEKANAEMEKLIREKTRKGYLEVGGKPEVKVLAKAVAKKAKTKEPKPQSMEATISPAERKAKAQKVLLMFANGQWDLAHSILENAHDEEWLFEQLLNGCKIEDGQPIPSNAIKKAFKKDEKSSPVLAMLNIMLCIPDGSKLLKTFKFEKLKELDFGVFEGEEMPAWMVHVLRLIPMPEILMEVNFLYRMSDSAAEALGKCKGDLYLGELKSLSAAAAEALSRHKGDLHLNGLESLSAAAAEALSRHKGDLDLRGLESLSEAAAEALSRHKGDLDLSGLESLSEAAAEALSRHKGDLDLSGLESLNDSPGHVVLAAKLASQKGYLSFFGLESLSDAAAESLSRHKGDLDLSGLKSLSDAAAEALSRHKGNLYLSGLESLSDSTGHIALATKLASQTERLLLNGLTTLSDTAAEALSKHKVNLYLRGLESLSDAAAKSLSKHKGYLELSGSIKQKVEKYKKQGDKK